MKKGKFPSDIPGADYPKLDWFICGRFRRRCDLRLEKTLSEDLNDSLSFLHSEGSRHPVLHFVQNYRNNPKPLSTAPTKANLKDLKTAIRKARLSLAPLAPALDGGFQRIVGRQLLAASPPLKSADVLGVLKNLEKWIEVWQANPQGWATPSNRPRDYRLNATVAAMAFYFCLKTGVFHFSDIAKVLSSIGNNNDEDAIRKRFTDFREMCPRLAGNIQSQVKKFDDWGLRMAPDHGRLVLANHAPHSGSNKRRPRR